MSPKHKLLLAAAALVAGGASYYYTRRKRPAIGGTVLLGELTVESSLGGGCECVHNEWMTDGTVKKTKVDRQRCIDDGLDFDGCAGASWLPSWLGGAR